MTKKGDVNSNRIGLENHNTFGSLMIITEYRGASDIDVYFPEYNWTTKSAYKEFNLGWIKCPYEPRTVGVGYIGEGKYLSKINKKNTKYYDVWHQMLRRCYDFEYKKKRPSYDGCYVNDDWLNFQNFAQWYEENYYEVPGEIMHLDKDILIKGNKEYGSDTCCFVPNSINCLFKQKIGNTKDLPIGVTRQGKNFRGFDCITNKTSKTLKTVEEAFLIYKNSKEKKIKELADLYIEYLPYNIYEFLINYSVDITDGI